MSLIKTGTIASLLIKEEKFKQAVMGKKICGVEIREYLFQIFNEFDNSLSIP